MIFQLVAEHQRTYVGRVVLLRIGHGQNEDQSRVHRKEVLEFPGQSRVSEGNVFLVGVQSQHHLGQARETSDPTSCLWNRFPGASGHFWEAWGHISRTRPGPRR